MDNNIEQKMLELAESAIDAGLPDADIKDIENQLGLSLQQALLESISESYTAPDWADGDYGPKDLALRFIERQKAALCSILCSPDNNGRLNPKIEKLLSPSYSQSGSIAGIAQEVLELLDIADLGIAGPTIAIYLTLWLMSNNLPRFCATCDN